MEIEVLLEESYSGRRVVGRLDHGQDVLDAITEICLARNADTAHFSVSGMVEELVLMEAVTGEVKPTVTFRGEGAFHIINLSGTVSVFGDDLITTATGIFSVSGPGGLQLVGGEVKTAQVAHAEVRIEIYDDVRVERVANFDLGRLVIDQIDLLDPPQRENTSTNSGEEKSVVSWDDAIATSADVKVQPTKPKREKRKLVPHGVPLGLDEGSSSYIEEDDADEIYAGLDLDAPDLSAGDVLNHPKLGVCRVIKVEDDESAHIRLPKGQIRKLSLVVCDVEFVKEEEDGRNVFKVVIN